jgi:cobalt-zinc-cadmium resistance protein CzcA
MSLGAIDFGLIVDGAVVMMENFIRRRSSAALHARERSASEARLHFFTSAATEVARPVFFGVLIIVAVYIPVLTLEGLEGKMFRPMAITVCSAILGALLLSLTVVPVAASLSLDLGAAHEEEGWLHRLKGLYERRLRHALAHRWHTLAVAGAVVTAAVASVPFLGTEFMPRLDEGSILIETRKLPSVSLADSVAISTRVEQVLLRFPEIRDVVTKIGRPDLATEAMGIYQGDVYISLRPTDEWTTVKTKTELIDTLADALGDLPGLEFNFTQPMAMRLDEVVSGVKADVAIKLFGRDLETLERIGADIQSAIADVEGAADVQREVMSGTSQIRLDLDREAAARYGVRVADVRAVLETAVGGTTVSEIRDGARRFAVVVRFPEAVRRDIATLGSLVVAAPGGERVPISRLASLSRVPEPEAVNHENGERRYVVQANVRGRDIGSFVEEARRHVADQVTLPEGYFLEWGGQFENQERASRRLMFLLPTSMAVIFLLLFLMFGRVRQSALVILNVPFALVGGIAALWIRGLNLNVSASVGFIALFGIAVLNGVVLVAAVNRLREEREQPLVETIVEAAGARLRPVLMTALVAALGFVPMAISHGAGAEIQRPLATVVIGGIVTSTLLTLIVLPTLYLVIEERVARRRARRA